MPAGRHRAAATRRPPMSRMLGGAAVGVLALGSLAAAMPGERPGSSGSTAEGPFTFDGTDGVVLEGRTDAAAQRSELRDPTSAPVPLAAIGTNLPEPVPAVTGQLWVTSAVNVRSGPSVEDEQLTTLAWADQVDVTGRTSDGWTQVIWEGAAAWVASDYLAEEEPVAEEPEESAAGAAEESGGGGVSSAACVTSPGIEGALAANAAAAYRAVCAAFPGVASAYGGYRAGDSGDHGSGHALDIMVSGASGWEIAGYLQAHAGELGITYLIFEQQIWMAGDSAGAWEYMSDRGSPTANHYDHVHVSTS